MAKQSHELLAFNRGVISPLLLARTDIQRTAMSAETQKNFIPSVLGGMSLRPGFQYIGATKSNAVCKQIPFVYSTTDTALVEVTDSVVRVRVADTLVTRVAVTMAVANGSFTTDVASWVDADAGSAVSQWANGTGVLPATGGYLYLLGDGTNAAMRTQTVTLGGGDSGKVHALRIVVARGPLTIRVGSSAGGGEHFNEVVLQTGVHSLAFTPAGSIYIQLLNREDYPVYVDSCTIEAAGAMELTGIWPLAALPLLRFTQSGAVIFVSCYGYRQQRIVRQGTGSWSVEDYVPYQGPFFTRNLSNITIAASGFSGDVTLTASAPIFRATHVGALFSLTTVGQIVSSTITVENTFTGDIVVTGVGAARAFGIWISMTGATTVTLQRSIGVTGNWSDVSSYLTNQSTTLNDASDNQTIYYRIGIKTGGYGGPTSVELAYTEGSVTGTGLVIGYTSPTVVTVSALKHFGAVAATKNWSEGVWSAFRGYPSAVALREGRLWWAGKNKFWGSVVDDYPNFDITTVGDSGPISRSIGDGPVDSISWLVSGAKDLVAGGGAAEYVGRSSAFGEPLTPTDFNSRKVSTIGSSTADAVELDTAILFVDKSGTRVYEVHPGANQTYSTEELTLLAPELGLPTITKLAVQRRPDTRIHALRSDGTVALLVVSKTEEVRAWVTVTTDGTIEDIVVLPGTTEDQVYYVVARTINAATVRYLEKWALVSETVGGQLNKQADSFVTYTGVAVGNITAAHLANRSVICWADGVDQGTFTASGAGLVTLPVSAANIVVGLTYNAQFKSTKLAQSGAALVRKTRVDHLGLVLANTHAQGIKYGPDFSTLDDLPLMEDGAATATGTIWSEYNNVYFEFNGTYDTDSRLCLQATAPRPCTVLAAIVTTDT